MKSIKTHIKHYIKYGIFGPLRAIFANSNSQNEFVKNSEKRKIFVMQTPTHGNLGDQGIAFAQKKFLLKNTQNCEYVEIPFEEVFDNAKIIKKVIKPNDLIVIHGGGNMGDMYLYEELTRRFIVSYFKTTRIISFPQTISFSDTILGKLALFGSKRVYSRNEKLTIVAREKKSYEIMKQVFGKDKVFLSPDIVLSLDERKKENRNGVVTCFRSDIEKNIDTSFEKKLMRVLEDKYKKVIVTDTIVRHSINIEQRSEELQKIWNQFRRAEVVLTDRLHGMIFCVITGTPCIAFKNSNHKIEYSYKNWLSHLSYIKFTDGENIESIINEIENFKILNQEAKVSEGIDYNKFSSIINLISEKPESIVK